MHNKRVMTYMMGCRKETSDSVATTKALMMGVVVGIFVKCKEEEEEEEEEEMNLTNCCNKL